MEFKKRTTNINEPARHQLSITRDDYALCQYLHYRQGHPSQKKPGWCSDEKNEIAWFIGVSRPGLYKMIDRLEKLGLIETDPVTGAARSTNVFIDTEVECKQSLRDGRSKRVNKVNTGCKQSLHGGVNKVTHTNKEYKEENISKIKEEYSAEINSAIPEIPFESKPKEKGTPGAESWTKEIATLFDRVNKEESEAAGIDHVEFNWQANSGMNFGALANIKKVLIADIKAKNNIPDDHTLKISFEHIFRCGFRLLLDNANGVGGLFSFTPMKIYKKYDDIKSFAHRGRQQKRTKSDLINEQRAKAIYEIATNDSEPGLFGY